MGKTKYIHLAFLLIFLIAVSCSQKNNIINTTNVDSIAVSYVRLSFALSLHDKDFVDGYFGPERLKIEGLKDTLAPAKIVEMSNKLIAALDNSENNTNPGRVRMLKLLVKALRTRAEMLSGKKYTFDRESMLLFNATSPIYSPEYYKETLNKIDSLLPGKAPINDKLNVFRKSLIVPANKLDTVIKAAINECRLRTLSYMQMPQSENFKLELVDSAAWGAYNWYKGNYQSLIQINSALPFYIDKTIEIACHEGYPGHHLYHSMQESVLYKKENLIEHSLIPLFSPKAVLSEGLANIGIELTFPGDEKMKFERDVLCKLAGIAPEKLSRYYDILKLKSKLKYAGIEAARRYLDGRMSKEMTIVWLMDYELRIRDEAENQIQFFEKYRSYIVTYSVGYDRIYDYLNRHGSSIDARRKLFGDLIIKPVMPEDLRN